MKNVYFDTNVYSHIHNLQHGLTRADVAKLFAKLKADKLRVYLSAAVLEETISALLSNEKNALRELRLIHRIAKRKKILNDYKEILDSIFHSYARGQPVPSFYQSPPPFLQFVLRDPTEGTLTNLRSLAQDSQDQIQQRKKTNEELFARIWPLVKEERKHGQQQSWDDYWNEHATHILETFATLCGVLEECKQKGIQQLLDFTPIKALSIGILSQGYANTYERTAFNRGDSRDLHHVIYASAIGTLVTHDGRFARVMRREAIPGFRVTDLHTLLKEL
jgi:predicted nucleic acid-binding protein